jgi:hypothetical protein
MGTTCTLVLVAGTRAIMGHVGDSRLYLHRDGRLHQLSTDHTLVEELVRSRAMTREQAVASQYGHALTRAVGVHPAVAVDTLVFDVLPGDRLLLCSDGVHGHLDDAALADVLRGDLEAVAERIVDGANRAGGRDNITVVAAEVRGGDELVVPRAGDGRLETLASTFLFRDLPLAHLQRVANLSLVQDVDRGEQVLREGEPGDGLYLVMAGRLTVLRENHAFGQLAPGDCAGAQFLLGERRATATVAAVEPSRLLFIPRDDFHRLLARRPWLGIELVTRVGRWCADALEQAAADPAALGADARV